MNFDAKQLAQFKIACSILDSLDEEYSDESWIVNQFQDGRNYIQRNGAVATWQVDTGPLPAPAVASEKLYFHCVSITLKRHEAQMARTSLDAYQSMMESCTAKAVGGLKQAVNAAFFKSLQTIISSTGLAHGVSPEDYPYWKSYEVDVTPDNFAEQVDEAVARIGEDCGTGKPNLLAAVMHPQRTRELREALRERGTDIEIAGEPAKPEKPAKPTFYTYHWPDVPVKLWSEKQCPLDTAFLIDFSKMITIRFEPDRVDWLRPPGSIQVWQMKCKNGRPIDEYEAFLYCYLSIATSQRNAHAKFNFKS